ncbi:MAG: YggS family pyridoxal phosphate-dependent enzyme [Chloroherpetonaceae bacterium]|nr:YggS family pyridoxal phosphate-dependent enzyme [Chloroherpetonaceae bacterium]
MIKDNLSSIKNRIRDAEFRFGRHQEEVQLIAVSKTKSAAEISEAFTSGQFHFGENYVQELQKKSQDPNIASLNLCWHFIGHLQSNKVKALFETPIYSKLHTIHTVDRESLAKEINKYALRNHKPMKILIEVNSSRETTKSGVLPEDLLGLLKSLKQYDGLEIEGLMTIASPEIESARSNFKMMHDLLLRGKALFNEPHKFARLSMGMSNDFEDAIQFGSTEVRLGTAIFGERV